MEKLRKTFPLLLMTVPFFLLVIVFTYLPLWGWYIAFIDYFPGESVVAAPFVGLKYFEQLFGGGFQFANAMRNTLIYSGIALLASPAPMLFAILINEIRFKRFRQFVQIVTSFPNFISWIIVYSLFFAFFSVDEGVINRLLQQLGLAGAPFDYLASLELAWPMQALISVWKSLGWTAIIYLAAIASIDPEQFQAAEVDGAGRLQQIRYILIPGLMPTFAVMFLLGIGHLLSSGFDQYFVFDNPIVRPRLDVLDTYVYRLGLEQLNFPLSTAVGVFKSAVSIAMLFLANAVFKRVNGKGII